MEKSYNKLQNMLENGEEKKKETTLHNNADLDKAVQQSFMELVFCFPDQCPATSTICLSI